MEFSIGQKIYVTDKTDNKKYPAKVVDIDDGKNSVKVHFIDWGKRYDEWLPSNSERISDEADFELEESFCDSQKDSVLGPPLEDYSCQLI